MTELTKLTLKEARNGLIAKTFSSHEITKAHLDAMEKNRHLNAYIMETPEHALSQAAASDKRIQQGQARKLEGLPIGIKDLFCTKGFRTTAGSKMLSNYIPPYESTVTQNLWNEGAVMLGKLNMDEFAMGSANLNSYFGPCISPWKNKNNPNKQIVPGGSSGGSTTAVSANIALAATASDTGGSIRQPAAFTGLVGIKPTYGLCSRWGMVAFASSFDQAGPVAKTVHDAAMMLEVMCSYDVKDETSLKHNIPSYSEHIDSNIKGLKIGIPKEYTENLNGDIQALLDQGIKWMQERGAIIKEITLPSTQYALPIYYILAPAEASSNLARYDGVRYGLRAQGKTLEEMYDNTRREGFGEEVRRRILIGTHVLSAGHFDAFYIRAQKARSVIIDDFKQAFEDVDVILTPTTPTEAFALDERPSDPVTMYLNDIFTVTVNLANLPGISVPAGLSSNGLPLGLQFIGPKFSEQLLFNVSAALEECANFKSMTKGL